MESITKKEYWDTIYNTKQHNEVSWFQEYPKTSMEFVDIFQLPKTAKIIDIGGGDSLFIDVLLENEYTNITVLDISESAINKSKNRLKEKAGSVKWIVSDITEFESSEKYDFWHDRAAFHSLTTEKQVEKYLDIANHSIANKGILILGTFSEDGPKKCSGLDIKQYSKKSMSAIFEKYFERIKCIQEDHKTPFNTIQNFLFCSFIKK